MARVRNFAISSRHGMPCPTAYIELRGTASLVAPAALAGGSAVGAASYFDAHFAARVPPQNFHALEAALDQACDYQ